MFHIQDSLYLDERELVFTMIRAQGAGGQNVNKVSSAVHLRFDVRASSLPAEVQDALCALNTTASPRMASSSSSHRRSAARKRTAPRRSSA